MIWSPTLKMGDDQGSLPVLVQEYEEAVDNLSISSLLSDIEKLKTSLIDDLTANYNYFVPLSNRISDVRKRFQDVTNSVRQLNTTVKTELHATAVDKLQEMLELQASCQYLLDVHTALERLEDRTASLFRRVGCYSKSACSTKVADLYEELKRTSESLLGGDGAEAGGGDENLLEAGDPCENFDLVEVEELLSKASYFNKSEVAVFQSFERAFVSQKVALSETKSIVLYFPAFYYSGKGFLSAVDLILMHYVDDIALLVSNFGGQQSVVSRVNEIAMSVGMSINTGKTKFFSSCIPDQEKALLGINGQQIEIDKFKNLGTKLLPNGQGKDAIVSRTDAARWTRLHNFLRSQWQRLIRISTDSPSFALPVALEFNQQCVLCALEVCGSTTEIETILRLADGLKETKVLVDKLCLDVWNRIFLPYLESQKTQETPATRCLQLRTSCTSKDTDDGVNSRSNVWRLSLVAIKPDLEWSDNGPKIIEDVCSTLNETLTGLSQRLFVKGLLASAASLGFMQSEAPGAASSQLAAFLDNMETFIADQDKYVLYKSVLEMLSETENFYTLHKVRFCGNYIS
ncbi:unnamed protein product [Dibothriocephalus latus]|uniref:Uncharacterized protein n=1 Tax=Dibothriocephalus latus TaxID=60516 RepID=A0A3P7NYL0_DIBLA|nr:unnamed protein product [Dibothriocephalus latus]